MCPRSKQRGQSPGQDVLGTHSGGRTRREFLQDATTVTAGVALGACFPDVGGRWPVERAECKPSPTSPAVVASESRVAEIYDELSVGPEPGYELGGEVIQSMVEQGLSVLTEGAPRPWSVLLPDYSPQMRIGIKVNCLNGYCPTSVPVVRALISTLQSQLGVLPAQIVVWDRRLDELQSTGFTTAALGVAVAGTITSTTDSSGPGYEDTFCTIVGDKTTRLSRILTELTDVTINCPVLKTHDISGITAGMKNIYGVIDNPGDFHTDLNTTLPALYALAPVCQRIRLTVIDALRAVTQGGTSSPMDTIPKRIVMAADPVAADTHALALVNRLRAEKNLGLSDVSPALTQWLQNAEQLALGRRQYQAALVQKTP